MPEPGVDLDFIRRARRRAASVPVLRRGWRAVNATRRLASRSERHRVFRERFFDLARKFTPVMAVDSDLGRIFVSTDDRMIGRGTFVDGIWGRDNVELVLDELGRRGKGGVLDLTDRVVIEVGANIGTTTLVLVRRFGAGRVYAFEPEPRNAMLLQHMVIANELEDIVKVRGVAISDHRGSVNIELSRDNLGDHRVRIERPLANALLSENAREVISVPACTLDDALASDAVDTQSIGVLWIDVQGHEAHVLAGAQSILGAPIPVVTEYWPYGLERAGGLRRFEELVAEHYRSVVDTGGIDDGYRILSADDIPSLKAHYTHPAQHTDLILLK